MTKSDRYGAYKAYWCTVGDCLLKTWFLFLSALVWGTWPTVTVETSPNLRTTFDVEVDAEADTEAEVEVEVDVDIDIDAAANVVCCA
jgi:hypothetical protein